LTPERNQADGYDTSDTFSDVLTDDEGDDAKATAGGNRRLAMPNENSTARPMPNQ